MMKYLVGLLVAVLVIVLATFGIQNPFPITLRFLQFQSSAVPLYLVIMLSALIGILLSALLGIPERVQRRLELRRLRHQVVEQAKQLSDLKARLPSPVMNPLLGELQAER